MSNYLRYLIAAQIAAAVLSMAAAILIYPTSPGIGGLAGIAFWIGMALIASAMPIPLPAGSYVSVGSAPVLASMVLGGPVAASIVGVFGTFDSREVRRQVPWYGVLNNHALIAGPAAISGIAYEAGTSWLRDVGLETTLSTFVGVIAAGLLYNALNNLLSALVVNARTGQSLRTVWAQDLRIVASNVVGLVPLSWLMAEVFLLPDGVGWWATPLFVVPLFTTRLAYSRYVETRELFEQTIGALANAVDARDRYTRGHSQRVSHIAEAMCRVMKLPETEIEKIKWAGLLHDVGKIGIRDNVLLKPGPLDKHERFLMNQHPTIGAEIVAPANQLKPEAPLIRYHHEWINGSGYPEGLEALDIPLGARILTVADAYEAMTSSRPYRLTPLTHEQAVGELEKFSGIQFDANIVPILVNLDREILDRPPDDPEELKTMLHAEDPRDTPEETPAAPASPAPDSPESAGATAAAASAPAATSAAPRIGTASEDEKPDDKPAGGSTPQGSAPRQSPAPDDVP